MEDYIPETEDPENNIEKGNIIIETKLYDDLLLSNEEFKLTMNLFNSFLEFKLQQKDSIQNCYYKEKYDIQTINELLNSSYKNIREVFDFYDKALNEKKINLIKTENKNIINLNYKAVSILGKEVETNLELKQIKLTKDEINTILLDEINSLKKKLNSKKTKNKTKSVDKLELKLKKYIDTKIEESNQKYIKIINEKDNEIKKLKETINSLKQGKDGKILGNYNIDEQKILDIEKKLNPLLEEWKEKEKKEVVKYNEINDNVNLLNDFKFNNFDTKTDINNFSNQIYNLDITFLKSVAVYKIIRNDEILYEMVYPDNKNGFNIIIYNILTNKIVNKINNAHKNKIHKIKHYYYSLAKIHILLTSSSDKSIKLWNITSNTFTNILNIENCFDGDNQSPFCLMFIKEDYFILGGSRKEKKKIWDKKGVLKSSIEKSNINYGRFIETTYIDNKPYILLSGNYQSESYDYIDNNIKTYKSKKKTKEHLIVNLFKKNNLIYLIVGDNGGNIIIFDFLSTNEIYSISIGGIIFSLCSINEKLILIGNSNNELKAFDVDKKSFIKNYPGHNSPIIGIEKIKTCEKDEYIITYDYDEIKVWK